MTEIEVSAENRRILHSYALYMLAGYLASALAAFAAFAAHDALVAGIGWSIVAVVHLKLITGDVE